MTFLVASSQPISGAFTVKRHAGFGILGADIPLTGDSGGSPIANDSIAADSEYCWEVVTHPASGTLIIEPDLTFSHTGASDGTWPWVAKLFEDGHDQGDQTIYDTFGDVAHSVTISNSQQVNTSSSVSINQSHLVSVSNSNQDNTSSSVEIRQTHLVQALNSQQSNVSSQMSVTQLSGLLISIENSYQTNIGSSGSIRQTHLVSAQNSVSQNTSSPVSIKQTHIITASNSIQLNISSPVALWEEQTSIIPIDKTYQTISIDSAYNMIVIDSTYWIN